MADGLYYDTAETLRLCKFGLHLKCFLIVKRDLLITPLGDLDGGLLMQFRLDVALLD